MDEHSHYSEQYHLIVTSTAKQVFTLIDMSILTLTTL
jgi:hypothetical protein